MNVIRKLELPPEGDVHSTRWINNDLVPLPPSRRTWGYSEFFGFWCVSHLCITTWMGASAILLLGLTVWESLVLLLVAKILIIGLFVTSGWAGGAWHIGYTVQLRSVLGLRGSFFGVVINVFLAIVWYASQTWLGGLCVSVMIGSLSKDFLEWKTRASSDMLMNDFVGFIIFNIISIPLMMISIERANRPMMISNLVVSLVMIGLTAWAVKTGGLSSLAAVGSEHQLDNSTGSRAWTWLYGITSIIGADISAIIGDSNFTRYSRRQGVQVPGIAVGLLVPGMLAPLFGVLTAAATRNIYDGEAYWNPLALCQRWILDEYGAKERAGAFFVSFGLLVSQLAVNVLGNGFAAGMDLAGLFPKFINTRRGCMISALLSLAAQPWKYYESSDTFIAVLSSFSAVLAPLMGVMLCDYFIIHKQRLKLSALYTPDVTYGVLSGFNVIALGTWLVAFLPTVPGMAASFNGDVQIPMFLVRYYQNNSLFGCLFASILYYVLAGWLFPSPHAGSQDEEDIYNTFTEKERTRKGMAGVELVTHQANKAQGQENLN